MWNNHTTQPLPCIKHAQTAAKIIYKDKQTLAPAYHYAEIYFNPILAQTSPGHKGGIVSYAKTKKQLERICLQDTSAFVTTLIDYYGLPNDFPGLNCLPAQSSAYERVCFLENALQQDIAQPNFIANYLLHEYEALLFCQVDKFADWVDDAPLEELRQIISAFETPEHINNSRQTAPSKRILNLVPRYKKVLHGPLIAGDIGLATIRQQCLHFDRWLRRIERLPSTK